MASQTSERVSTLPRVKPMRLRLIKEPFDNFDYLMEWKADGFRAVAYIENRECKLVSRNLRNLRFESLRAALAALPVTNAILDGEIICLDPQGVSRFNWLLSARGAGQAIFYSFDLLWLNSVALARNPSVRAEVPARGARSREPVSTVALRPAHRGRRQRVFRGNLPTRPRGHCGQAKDGNLPRGTSGLAQGQSDLQPSGGTTRPFESHEKAIKSQTRRPFVRDSMGYMT